MSEETKAEIKTYRIRRIASKEDIKEYLDRQFVYHNYHFKVMPEDTSLPAKALLVETDCPLDSLSAVFDEPIEEVTASSKD